MLTARDKQRLTGVHADMVKVVNAAHDLLPARMSNCDFFVIYGVRKRDEQYKLWRSCHNLDGTRAEGTKWLTDFNGTPRGQKTPEGAEGTGVSRHQDGLAVDLGINYKGVLTWDAHFYDQLANVMLEVAAKLGVSLTWGGLFPSRDGPHFELNKRFYK